ncbi:MAG: sugar phosphate isomerase/epimerase family protein [Chloroflexota bacterium]
MVGNKTSNSGSVRVGCQANAWERDLRFGTGPDSPARLDLALAELAAAGYEGAELPARAIADLDRPQDVRAVLAKHRLALIAVHLGGNFYDDQVFRERTLPTFRRVATCAAAAGADGMVVSGAPKREPSATPGVRGATLRKTAAERRAQTHNLAELGRMHRDLGLATWYHNHGHEFAHGEEELQGILEIDQDVLSLCFDIGNAARVLPGPALFEALGRHWDRIGCLHYKDIKGGRNTEALGDGEIDFAAISSLARERRFRGWAVAEIEPGRNTAPTRTVLEDARLSQAVICRTLGIPLPAADQGGRAS